LTGVLLALDIGNTRIGCALFEGERMLSRWELDTETDRSSDSYAEALQRGLAAAGASGDRPEAVIVSSVVRGMADTLGRAVRGLWEVSAVEAGVSMDLGVEVAVSHPGGVGTDRLLAAGEAYRVFGGPLVVAGLGTAVTADIVSETGRFLGGAIVAGLRTGLWALHARTSLLPEAELTAPGSALGRDTRSCLQAGAVYGAAGAVDRIAEELAQEVEGDPKLVLTGGDASLVSPFLRTEHHVERDLVLRGLASTWKRYAGRQGRDDRSVPAE
jgi:type III pantothenate kinase